jgi:monofunctional biosynthetic peptidoglycan transglycosylase
MSEKLLYDFESPAEIAQWRNQDDPVMGGLSRSRAGAGLQSTLVFAGRVSLENNGGFASVRSFGLSQAVDISAYNAIQLRVLGDGKVYAFTMSTGTAPNLMYQARFRTTPGEWMTITLPYADFEPTRFGFRPPGAPSVNARDVRLLGFIISDKQAGPFELGVDWIKAVR